MYLDRERKLREINFMNISSGDPLLEYNNIALDCPWTGVDNPVLVCTIIKYIGKFIPIQGGDSSVGTKMSGVSEYRPHNSEIEDAIRNDFSNQRKIIEYVLLGLVN